MIGTIIYTEVIGYLVGKTIDKAASPIKKGFDGIEQYNDFSAAYDDALRQYQERNGEDRFYQVFYAEDHNCLIHIQKMFDRPRLTRELHNEIAEYIVTRLGDECTEKISAQYPQFIADLFANLLYMDTYHQKIEDYRQDSDLAKILRLLQLDILEDICQPICKDHSKEFTEKLFLERQDPKGKTLKNVYVAPLCQNLHSSFSDPEDIYDVISEFIKKDEQILLITANAGMGKSTLMSKLTYDYLQNGHLYGFLKVFFVNLGKLSADTNDPLELISSKLKIGNSEHFNDSLLLLDAYDELTGMNSDIHYFFDMLAADIAKYRCKVIITSRLNYIDLSRVQVKATTVELLAFNENLRKEWLDSYGKKINSYDYLTSTLQGDDNDLMGIPIVLYFIAYGNLDIKLCKNKYDLYMGLFGLEAIRERAFIANKEQLRYDRPHRPLYANAENLYQLMQDISLRLFQRNTDLIIDRCTISELLHSDSEKDTLLKYCGIVSYFNNKGDGVFEYVHKSIYEFYLSVKIYTTLKQIFQAYSNNKENINDYIVTISALLLYAQLTKQTLEFIYQQIEADIPELSKIANNITDFIYNFLRLGPNTIPLETFNSLTQIENIFFNFWGIYNRLILLTNKQLLSSWLKDVDKKQLLFKFISLSYYDGLDLEQVDIKNINLYNIDLTDANLTSATLTSADLTYSNLAGANLTKAILIEAELPKTNLTYANLTKTNFTNANLTFADLTYADLNKSILTETNLSGSDLDNSNLNRADLTQADLVRVNLASANLTGANLTKANLTQANLTNANLTGTTLIETNLARTDLTGADLTGADLTGADLTFTNLSVTNLTGSDLTDANLTGANLTGANLIEVNLTGANLTGISFSDPMSSTNLKIKITLEQLNYFIEKELDPNYFEVYKDADIKILAKPEDITLAIERLRK